MPKIYRPWGVCTAAAICPQPMCPHGWNCCNVCLSVDINCHSLLTGAWNRRGNLRLVDALYVELAEQLDAPIITTDERLAATVPQAETPT